MKSHEKSISGNHDLLMVFPRFTQDLGRNHPWNSAVFKPEGSPGICPETAGRRRGTRRSSPPRSDPGVKTVAVRRGWHGFGI